MPVKKFRSLQEMKASASSETESLPREVRVVARGHLAVAVPSKASEPLTTETVLDTQEDLRVGSGQKTKRRVSPGPGNGLKPTTGCCQGSTLPG